MVRTSCRTAAKSFPHPSVETMARERELSRSRPAKAPDSPGARPAASRGDLRDESVTAVYSAAGRHHAADGRRPSRLVGRLPAFARLGIAASRLPDDSGENLLSRRQPGGHGLLGDRASGAPVRPEPWSEPDDLHEFLWQLHHYASVRAGPEH